MKLSKLKTTLILAFCALMMVCAVPNFVEIKNWPKSLNYKVNYGLDLKGGVQLLLKVDFESYVAGQIDIASEFVRKALRKNRIGYSSLRTTAKTIAFVLRDKADEELIRSSIGKLDRDLDIKFDDNQVEISYSDKRKEQILDGLIEQTIEIIRHRIDETGTLEPSIQRQGNFGILLQVPGLQDPIQLKKILGKTAKLTFHLIDENVTLEAAKKGLIPYGVKLVQGVDLGSDGRPMWYPIKERAVITGDTLVNAQLSNSESPKVAFNFNTLGAKLFADITSKHVGQRLAIVLDDKVISAPVINGPIPSGSGEISGNFTVSSANELALLLRAGALPAPLTIAEEKVVGPSLGEDSIMHGKKAGLIAFAAIAVFMVLLYGQLGMFASLALVVNVAFILTAMGMLNATLTMPGIAGIILTMGMAVDTNVLIFERIKEELRIKSTLQYAIKQGFHHAFATILDSNLTTLIAAFTLYAFGSGIIRGFAVTLTIGILSSMFTAITLTKLCISEWISFRGRKEGA